MTNSISIGAAYKDQEIVGGSVDNTPVGATTKSTGAFTTLTATSTTSLGAAASALVGMHGSTAAQASAILTALTTGAATALVGFASTAQLQALVDSVNSIVVCLRNKGIIAT